MKLHEWMEWRGVRDAVLAERLDVSRATVSRVRRGKMQPSLDLARRIYAETAGQVEPNDLAELPALERERA